MKIALLLGASLLSVSAWAADDPISRCFEAIYTNPKLLPIAAKVGNGTDAESFTREQLGNPAFATPEEKLLIADWYKARRLCVNFGADHYGMKFPAYLHIFEWQQAEFSLLMAALYQGKMSYGEFVTKRQRLVAEGKLRANQEQQIVEARARQAAANAIFTPAPQAVQPAQPASR